MNMVLLEMIRSLRRLPVQMPAEATAWEQFTADLAAHAPEVVLDRLAAKDYLTRLPAEQRELLRLRFYESLSHNEIAARLGISTVTARVRLCRALTELKTIAGAGPGEDRP
jgi:RNA polymerase sigma factor (sigma-70 family)